MIYYFSKIKILKQQKNKEKRKLRLRERQIENKDGMIY